MCLGMFSEEARQAALSLLIYNLLFYSHLFYLALMLVFGTITNRASEKTLSAPVDMLCLACLLSPQLLCLLLLLKDASLWSPAKLTVNGI